MADGNGSNPAELAVPSAVARLNYFYGQLLSQADLKAEQSYHLQLRRLMQRETFGVGTVAGLAVRPGTSEGTILIKPGLALDAFGRELLLTSEQCMQVLEPALVSAGEDIADSSLVAMSDALEELFEVPIAPEDVEALQARLLAAGMEEAGSDPEDLVNLAVILGRVPVPDPLPLVLPPGATLATWLFDALVGTTYVSLSYLERGAELAPALLDAACCGDTACHPTRLREGVLIHTSFALPGGGVESVHEQARQRLSQCFLDEDNPSPPPDPVPPPPVTHACAPCLTDIVLDAWRGLPPTEVACSPLAAPKVGLAAVYWSRYPRVPPAVGTPSRVLSIDNTSFRPLAPSPVVVRALFETITQCTTPVQIAPIIYEIEPANGARLSLVFPTTESTVIVRARSTGPLVILSSPPLHAWEVVFYPPTSPEVVWNDAFNPKNLALALDVDDPHRLTLTMPSGETLDPGTYVWRINPEPDVADALVVTRVTNVPIDGTPHPITAVPSGDGRQGGGGTFEARFYISND